MPEQELPFAGELIQVRPEHTQWEGAAERVLRGFGLSLLVPDEHYRTVSEWINDNHLGTRLVYYRVPPTVTPGPAPSADGNATLASKLEIADTELYPWLERELAHRAGYECVETMDQFRRAPRAVTKAGQVKGAGGRHEKDDRRRIDDRSTYVRSGGATSRRSTRCWRAPPRYSSGSTSWTTSASAPASSGHGPTSGGR